MTALVDDLLGDFPLTAHRIGGHRASLEIQEPQKPRNRRDLVRFLVRRDLRQNHTFVARPGADHVQG
jgi:hypothetical protein